MTVQDMIEMLNDVEDKSLAVVIPVEIGFVSVCSCDSGVAHSDTGEDVFVFLPCRCFPEELTVDFKSDDLEISKN